MTLVSLRFLQRNRQREREVFLCKEEVCNSDMMKRQEEKSSKTMSTERDRLLRELGWPISARLDATRERKSLRLVPEYPPDVQSPEEVAKWKEEDTLPLREAVSRLVEFQRAWDREHRNAPFAAMEKYWILLRTKLDEDKVPRSAYESELDEHVDKDETFLRGKLDDLRAKPPPLPKPAEEALAQVFASEYGPLYWSAIRALLDKYYPSP